MPASNRLAVVICTYNRSASLIETLTSLYACGYAGKECVDIVVVANNCSDDTLDRLADFRASHPRGELRLACIEETKASRPSAPCFFPQQC